MILDPVNGVTSLQFYRRVAEQSPVRSVLYLFYLSTLFAVAATFAVGMKVMPGVEKASAWMENSIPVLTVSGGKITSNLEAPLTLRPPDTDIGFIIDTNRTTPVAIQELEGAQAHAFLTQNAFYYIDRPGQLKMHDLSKVPADRPIIIDPAAIRTFTDMLRRVVYPVSLIVTLLGFFAWKLFTSMMPYSIIALIANNAMGANLPFRSLFNIAVYAQTLIVIVWGMLLFAPAGFPGFGLAALAATTAYIWLGIKRTLHPSEPPPQPAA